MTLPDLDTLAPDATRTASARKADAIPFVSSRAALNRYLVGYAEGRDAELDFITEADWCKRHGGVFDARVFQRAQQLGIPLIDLALLEIDRTVVELTPPAVARRLRVMPLSVIGGVLGVAVCDPADADIVPTLSFLTSDRVATLVADPQQVRDAIANNYDRVEDAAVARQLGLDMRRTDVVEASEQDARRLAAEQPIVRLIDDMFAEAARRRASDIHLRPGADGLDFLLRIDNELIPVRQFIPTLRPALVSRIKVIGGMNVADHRVAQDGRASHTLPDGRKIDLRISVLPTVHGESAAIRLLDTSQGLRSISQLGLSDDDRTRLVDLMTRNHGMILVTGPTGSGKSTTLYAALLEARKERQNILTVEDPVEYEIDDVQQMQVNRAAGFTFASALRNILRHDPDVIMVGEIRDGETARIAVESALTGHLLFSTLHTNTAATTVTRLIDLGVEPFLLRATLLAVLSQRLMRRNCPECRVSEVVPAHRREALDATPDEPFLRGAGCAHCDGTGVRGRVAAYELMTVSPAIRHLIQPGCEADAIHDVALREGMTSITQSALALARAHVVSFDEAFRLRAD